jgi:hypothetical protein
MSWLHSTTSSRLGVAFFVAAGAALRAPEAACPGQLVPSRRSHFERRRRIALQAEPLAGILLTADMARARYPRKCIPDCFRKRAVSDLLSEAVHALAP